MLKKNSNITVYCLADYDGKNVKKIQYHLEQYGIRKRHVSRYKT